MKRYKNLIICILFLTIFSFIPSDVYAANAYSDGNVCVNGWLYRYDFNKRNNCYYDSDSDGVYETLLPTEYRNLILQNVTNISWQDVYYVRGGTVGPYTITIDGKQVSAQCNYADVSSEGRKCVRNGNNFKSCTAIMNDYKDSYTLIAEIMGTTAENSKIKEEFQGFVNGQPKYRVTIKGVRGIYAVKVNPTTKYDSTTGENLTAYLPNVYDSEKQTFRDINTQEVVGTIYTGTRYDINANGDIVISNLNPGEHYYIAFLVKTFAGAESCADTEVGHYEGTVSNLVPNNYYYSTDSDHGSDANYAICRDYLKSYSGTKLAIAKSFVPECTTTEYPYEAGVNILDTIRAKIATAQEFFTTYGTNMGSGKVSSDSLQCDFRTEGSNTTTVVNADGTKSYRYTYANFLEGVGGYYWQAFCTETMTITYSTPKLVTAGQGFEYETEVKIERDCSPIKMGDPKKLNACKYGVECWGGPANHTGEGGAGPTKSFDDCILSCDGGNYTQACINSCYSSVYEKEENKDTVLSFSGVVEYGSLGKDEYASVTPVAFDGVCDRSIIGSTRYTNKPVSSCYVTSGNNKVPGSNCNSSVADVCKSEHGRTFTYLDGCNQRGSISGTMCYEVYTNGIPVTDTNRHDPKVTKCVEGITPDEDYQQQVLAAAQELQNVYAAMSEFTDDTTRNEFVEYQVVNSYTGVTDKFNLDVLDVVENAMEGNLAIVRTDSKGLKYYHIERTVTINLPSAYLAVAHAQPGTSASQTMSSSINYGIPSNTENYYAGGNKYYTNVFSPVKFNKYDKWISYNTDGEDVITNASDIPEKNIKVIFKNFGSWDQWGNAPSSTSTNGIALSCSYDVSRGLVAPPTDEGSGGLDIVFRPIDLENPFPNRDPRFNWSEGAKLTENYYYYPVDPSAVIDDIVEKGYDIYNDPAELDYDIVLTKDNIKEIRRYNATHSGYLDYDMDCSTYDGKTVCTSNFLGESTAASNSNSYLSYTKRGQAGCNNERNGICLDEE